MRHVLPKTQAEMERKNNRIAELIEEVRHLNTLREKDHQTIVSLLKEARQNPQGKTSENEE